MQRVQELVKELFNIRKDIFIEYNVIERRMPLDKKIKCRCRRFLIAHKQDECVLIIEYIKNSIVVSFGYNPKYSNSFLLEDVVKCMPMRFKEIIARIKKAKEVDAELLENILENSIKNVKREFLQIIGYADSSDAFLKLLLDKLIKDDKKHTYIYLDFPIFGKINTLFRASRKDPMGNILKKLDMQK